MAKNRHIESKLQINCHQWFCYRFPKLKSLLFAVPNGGNRNAREGAIMKREGVTSGVSDLILLKGNNDYNSLCIEMKKEKDNYGNKRTYQSKSQKGWQKVAEEHGNKYIVVRSIEQFINEVNDYLEGES